MAKLRLSSAAQKDLLEISELSVERFGEAKAIDFLDGFDRIFRLLRDQPNSGQLRDELGTADRSFSHRPYRILYQVKGDEVLITRIIHQARDVRTALLNER